MIRLAVNPCTRPAGEVLRTPGIKVRLNGEVATGQKIAALKLLKKANASPAFALKVRAEPHTSEGQYN